MGAVEGRPLGVQEAAGQQRELTDWGRGGGLGREQSPPWASFMEAKQKIVK